MDSSGDKRVNAKIRRAKVRDVERFGRRKKERKKSRKVGRSDTEARPSCTLDECKKGVVPCNWRSLREIYRP